MPDVCCGFGGTFCVKYPDISERHRRARRPANIVATGADVLLAGDLGCLMNMAGKLQRDGAAIEVRHVAEVLAGMTGSPADRRPADGAWRGADHEPCRDVIAASKKTPRPRSPTRAADGAGMSPR